MNAFTFISQYTRDYKHFTHNIFFSDLCGLYRDMGGMKDKTFSPATKRPDRVARGPSPTLSRPITPLMMMNNDARWHQKMK